MILSYEEYFETIVNDYPGTEVDRRNHAINEVWTKYRDYYMNEMQLLNPVYDKGDLVVAHLKQMYEEEFKLNDKVEEFNNICTHFRNLHSSNKL